MSFFSTKFNCKLKIINNIIHFCKLIAQSECIDSKLVNHLIEHNQNDISKTISILNQYKITLLLNGFTGTEIADDLSEFYELLNISCQKRLNRSVYQLNETQRVATAFAKQKIPLISYKGLTFTKQFYKRIDLRDSVDVDFAISKQHLTKIGEIMSSLGYREAKGKNNYNNLKKTRGYYIDYSWLLYNENNQPVCNVEFHWRATATALYVPLIFDDIFEKQTIIQVQNQTIRTFQPVYQALLIIIHHGIVDGWGKLRHLIDLTQIDKTMNAQQWQNLIELTKKHKTYKAFMIGCCICEQLLEYTFINKMNTHQVKKLSDKMIQKIRNDQLNGKWSKQPIKLIYYLQMRDNFSDFFQSLIQFIRYSFIELVFKLKK